MLALFRLVLRSLWRNPRRSAISILAVWVGVFVVTVAFGLGEGLSAMLVDGAVNGRLGALQVHRAGYQKATEASPLSFAFPTETVQSVAAVEGVVAATPRIRFNAIITNGQIQSMMMVEAIDVAGEAKVCPERAALTALTGNGVMLSQELLTALGKKVGDTLTLTASSKDGAMNALDIEVAAVSPGAGFLEQKRVMVVGLAFAQELLSLEGQATEIAVRIADAANDERTRSTQRRVAAALGASFEVNTWDEVMPFLRDAKNRLQLVLRGVSLVLFVLVVLSIVNTTLMNVFERTREIGTMLAVGFRRRHILLLFLLESVLLCGVGAVLGVLSAEFALWLLRDGLLLTPPGAAVAYRVVPRPSAQVLVATFIAALVGGALAAVFPARRASKLSPVEALSTA